MKKQLKDYVPFYIGQRILSYWGETQEIETILGIVGDKVILQIDDDNIESSIDLSFKQKKGKEPKLILRSFLDFNESDIRALATITAPKQELKQHDIEGAIMIMKKRGMKGISFDDLSAEQLFSATKVLIEMGFDVFGLIECGLAVEPQAGGV